MQSVKSNFPTFSHKLTEAIDQFAKTQEVKAGEIIMRTGQYIKNTILVIKGKIKIYRQDDDGGEFFIYYLQPGQACAISMICATKHEKIQLMEKLIT